MAGKSMEAMEKLLVLLVQAEHITNFLDGDHLRTIAEQIMVQKTLYLHGSVLVTKQHMQSGSLTN